MEFKDHLDFLAPNDIRIRGTRIGIETVLHEYLQCGRTPDAIVQSHPVLTLPQVHATLSYYFDNKDAVESYLSNWLDESRKLRELQDRSPPPGVARIRAMKHGTSNGAIDHD